jgi:hypothetical protein
LKIPPPRDRGMSPNLGRTITAEMQHIAKSATACSSNT